MFGLDSTAPLIAGSFAEHAARPALCARRSASFPIGISDKFISAVFSAGEPCWLCCGCAADLALGPSRNRRRQPREGETRMTFEM